MPRRRSRSRPRASRLHRRHPPASARPVTSRPTPWRVPTTAPASAWRSPRTERTSDHDCAHRRSGIGVARAAQGTDPRLETTTMDGDADIYFVDTRNAVDHRTPGGRGPTAVITPRTPTYVPPVSTGTRVVGWSTP